MKEITDVSIPTTIPSYKEARANMEALIKQAEQYLLQTEAETRYLAPPWSLWNLPPKGAQIPPKVSPFNTPNSRKP